jgi:hypothetical protein
MSFLVMAGMAMVLSAVPAFAALPIVLPMADVQVIGGPAPSGAVGDTVQLLYKIVNHGPDVTPDNGLKVEFVAPGGTELVGDFGPGWTVVVRHQDVWTLWKSLPVQKAGSVGWRLQPVRIVSSHVTPGHVEAQPYPLLFPKFKDTNPLNNKINWSVKLVGGPSPSATPSAATPSPTLPAGPTPTPTAAPTGSDSGAGGVLAAPSDAPIAGGDAGLTPAGHSSSGLDLLTLTAVAVGGGLVVGGCVVLSLVWRRQRMSDGYPVDDGG